MCIIILNQTGKLISKDTLAHCATQNPDGFGFFDLDKKTLFKSLDKDEFISELGKRTNFVAHFRLKTHGPKSLTNVHPFEFRRDRRTYYLFHNGIEAHYQNFVGSEKTDSEGVAKILSYLPVSIWAEYLGGLSSRFIVVSSTGKIMARTGQWASEKNVFFSNWGYRIAAPKISSYHRGMSINWNNYEQYEYRGPNRYFASLDIIKQLFPNTWKAEIGHRAWTMYDKTGQKLFRVWLYETTAKRVISKPTLLCYKRGCDSNSYNEHDVITSIIKTPF